MFPRKTCDTLGPDRLCVAMAHVLDGGLYIEYQNKGFHSAHTTPKTRMKLPFDRGARAVGEAAHEGHACR